MASRKRARTSSISGSSSSEAAVTTVELSGGWALSPELVQLWRSGRLTDTVVEVDGRSFAAHRVVLASACDYFNRHYDNEHMRGADHPKLLEHVSAAAFEPLLAFLYEGTCTFDESLLAPVLRAASYLNVEPLEKAAVAALTQRLSPSNALAMWTWGEELPVPELAEAAKETALRGFDELEKIEEATLTHMRALVADDRLTAKSEDAVFSAVARFAEAKQPAEAELHDLLRNVRFAQLSRSFLQGTVRTSPMLQTVAGQSMIIEMLAPIVSGPAQQPRSGFGARFLYVIGGRDQANVEVYDFQSSAWSAATPLPEPREDTAAGVLDGKIYVLGACPKSKEIRVFDPQTGDWAAGAPMGTARAVPAAAVVGGKLYAIGGYDGTRLSSVEAFDPQTGAWADVAPMPMARSSMGVAVLDSKIYVVGGDAQDASSNTVEVYYPQTNTWATAAPMVKARFAHGTAELAGKIYVAGGCDAEGDRLSSAEVFDPQTNTWTAVAPMSKTRSSFSLTAVRGKLYAVGGESISDEDLIDLATVEAYDPQQDRWEPVAPMAESRLEHCAVAL